MSEDLRGLLHQLADHETAAADATAPATTVEVGRVLSDLRTRRARRVAVVGAAAVTVLAVGVATALVLTPEPRVPAVDPGPAVATSGPPTPTPSATADPTAVADAPAGFAGWGVVASLASPPRPAWSLAATDVVPSPARPDASVFAEVETGAPYGSFTAVDAGDVLVASVVDVDDGGAVHLTGVDAATGAVRWVLDPVPGEPRTWTCAGLSAEALVVCHGTDATDAQEVHLLDPRDGAVVRTVPLWPGAQSLGLAGGVVVVHGTGDELTTARWDGIDATTGATLWSHVEAGGASDEEVHGDVFPTTVVQGDRARLHGFGHDAVIDIRTGERVDDPVPSGVRVWAPSPGARVPVLTSGGGGDAGPGDAGDALQALDPDDGTLLWSSDMPGGEVVGLVGDGVLVSGDEELVHLDLATGQVRWSAAAGTVVATDGAHVLVDHARSSGPTSVLALADGSVVWSLPPGEGRGWGPWLSEGFLTLPTTDGVEAFRR